MLVRLPRTDRFIAHKDTILEFWHRFDSPIGPLSLCATERGLARVAFASEHPPTPSDSTNHILEKAIVWLQSYFSGRFLPVDFPLELDDDSFTRRAQWALADIPPGSTRSYFWLAQAAGSPSAIRAAGTACATNPLPLVLPCHRIVRADGTVGRYRGGQLVKVWLLEHERNHGATTGV
ncbi:methylated-DNA--[protein]-cysteine S-methyltransferase [Corynebacterium cystitidis]|uniref:methylated-DNA--[protein]-cysteine S-methyltransferase n=1 Tax=Corynebacterium cystitidis DSM 20524 TaxID=1121357 RepID=A0A1H9TUL9_9CORY|nr:methylated-DNA--[protein]-cysteine S-methyltransferase [Corynebacterium cystitidis]WJY81941.1 Methylated-DNA--protein-cysteine methyltransferase [Corynebacterium cystitidis DSM 20524]SES00836.1 methylated-DNA-[protein]-cysteine S-methyltransferase [Corynebacterium cystitidis DSM 20524]SNV81781.1 methylated DNA-protein cysteine methyltransferase [Corynebacterium cystitidis]